MPAAAKIAVAGMHPGVHFSLHLQILGGIRGCLGVIRGWFGRQAGGGWSWDETLEQGSTTLLNNVGVTAHRKSFLTVPLEGDHFKLCLWVAQWLAMPVAPGTKC